MSKDYVNATIITKYARRKLAIWELARLKRAKVHRGILSRFVKRHLPGFMAWRREGWKRSATRMQAAWRGYKLRRDYYWYPGGEYYQRRQDLAHRRLRYKLWALWRSYKWREEMRSMQIAANLPRTLADWQDVVDLARRPLRTVSEAEAPAGRRVRVREEERRIDKEERARKFSPTLVYAIFSLFIS